MFGLVLGGVSVWGYMNSFSYLDDGGKYYLLEINFLWTNYDSKSSRVFSFFLILGISSLNDFGGCKGRSSISWFFFISSYGENAGDNDCILGVDFSSLLDSVVDIFLDLYGLLALFFYLLFYLLPVFGS